MAEALTIVWFATAIGGALACLIGLVSDGVRRRTLLLVGGACFGVAGLLGILSVGIVFLALTAVCFVAASRIEDGSVTTASD